MKYSLFLAARHMHCLKGKARACEWKGRLNWSAWLARTGARYMPLHENWYQIDIIIELVHIILKIHDGIESSVRD